MIQAPSRLPGYASGGYDEKDSAGSVPMRLDAGQIEVLDDRMAEVYRQMTGAQRLAIASGMYASARRMLLSHLRATHPEWSDERIVSETARRLSHGAV